MAGGFRLGWRIVKTKWKLPCLAGGLYRADFSRVNRALTINWAKLAG
jgi:hypothetical protein